MEEIYLIAAIWLGLAVISTIISNHLKISMALIEICVGIAAVIFAQKFFGVDIPGVDAPWLKFIAGSGAILLTFLSGAELDPTVLRVKWKEIILVGAVGFLAPFLGGSAIAYYLLNWGSAASLLAGVVLSCTSVAVVYSVMLEYGFNKTEFGKGVLGACFINDLGTVIALGLLFAPFTMRTVIFVGASILTFIALPFVTRKLTHYYGNRTAAIRTKWILLVLFSLGALALWAGSEAVLPAYIAGMVLAGGLGRDHLYIRRLRTLTIGFLTPFYFLRAGAMVSFSAVVLAPLTFLLFLLGKVISKIFGLYPVIGRFREHKKEKWYYTLLMSTGLTFGTISAIFGLSHNIISTEQYSILVAVVIGSALIPTMIANAFFLPKHLLKREPLVSEEEEIPELEKA